MRVALLLATIGAALAVSGCGGDSGSTAAGTTISADEYVSQADELCTRVAGQVSDLALREKGGEILSGGGSDQEKMDQLADLVEEQLKVISALRADMEQLGTPALGAEDVEQILDKTRSAEDELGQAVGALRDGDEIEFAAAMKRYGEFSQQSASIARDSELDFEVCGSGA
jgi:hypothetical protein